jgi:hypothetical protein
MKTLALRIYLTVVAVLLVFALVTGWLAQRQSWITSAPRCSRRRPGPSALPPGASCLKTACRPSVAPKKMQARVFLEWADRLRLPMALDNRLRQTHCHLALLAGSPCAFQRLVSMHADPTVRWTRFVGMRPGFWRQKARQRPRMPRPGHGGAAATGGGPPACHRCPCLDPGWRSPMHPTLVGQRAPALHPVAAGVFVAVAAGCLAGGQKPHASSASLAHRAWRCLVPGNSIIASLWKGVMRWPPWRAVSTKRPSASKT